MFRPTERQTPLFGAETWLGARARERLRGSWAEWFRAEILPILFGCEEVFADLYGERGRPNWSVARMLGVCLLQQLEDLDDQAALDALSFDVRWQYALGLTSEDAYLSRRSLVDFRGRLVAHDPDGERIEVVFDRVCQAGLERLKLSTAHQRLDSTLIASNIRSRGRLSLTRETIRVFLRGLDDGAYQQVSNEIRAWHERDDEGWEQDCSGTEGEGRLHRLGGWVRELVDQFATHETVRECEPYQLLVRLLREHAGALGQSFEEEEPDDTDEPPSATASGNARNRRKARRRTKAAKSKGGKARFWSPHDPDASFGHKGLGYHVHITETCRNTSTELLTDYDVVTAADSDVGRAMPVIERLRKRNLAADTLYADGGYPTPANLVEARNAGTELYAPVHRGRMAGESFARGDFVWDEGQLVACPAGHPPTRRGSRASSDAQSRRRSLHVFFDAATCNRCPDNKRCPVRQPNNDRSREYRLDIAADLLARDERWAEQKTDEWRRRYRIRAGVEATMSELKRGHGLGRLRVRRLPRVRLQVALKATACNLKRWARVARRRQRRGSPTLVWAAILAVLMADRPAAAEAAA